MKKIVTSILFLLSLLPLTPKANAQDCVRKKRFMITSQFAGSIGFLTFGGGMTNKKQSLHHELLYGHVPKKYGGPTDKLTYKLSWYPFSAQLTPGISWKIISPGFFAAKNFGDRFPLVHSRSKYPRGYYWWAPGLRFHLALNSAMSFRISKKEDRKLLVYFETNTNERYITTYFSDSNSKVMSFWEIWQLGFGAKVLF